MSFKIHDNIECLEKKEWNCSNNNSLLKKDSLKHFDLRHKTIKHYYIVNNQNRFYAQKFNISISKIGRYSKNFFLRLISSFSYKIKLLYLSNSFITNIPFCHLSEIFDLHKLVQKIQKISDSDIVVVPDFLINSKYNKSLTNEFVKIEVESEMTLAIDSEWTTFNDYKLALKTKYRKLINKIESNSTKVKVRKIDENYLKINKDKIQKLYNNVYSRSSFSGPRFNTSIFADLAKENEIKIYGYFLVDKLVAFSSEIHYNQKMYSYFVGLDYKINKTHSVYAKILCESIKEAIKQKKKELVFGRTANEFKSNFGAVPKRAYIFIYFKNKVLKNIIGYFFKKIKIKKWHQRSPFKN